MSDSETDTGETPTREIREAVGLFAEREKFESTVAALLEAGFSRADLSVLSSHESIDAAGREGRPWNEVLTALVGELKYEVPLVASGAVLLAGGPVVASIAGLVGVSTAGIAVKELVDEVTSTPHTEDFARSLEAGSIILWVYVADAAAEEKALRLLREGGGDNVHVHVSARAAD